MKREDPEEKGRPTPSAPARRSFNDDSNDLVQVMRKLPPSDYSMKIQSFSNVMKAFGKSSPGNFESTKFSAAGHKWVLSVYPCGNKKEMGEGHISFYLKLAERLHSDMVIYATYKFFVYDQLRDNYLTIQDIRERRFHALKAEWGVAKAMELNIFRDPSNGFLINDSCVFGVEVFVINTSSTAATMSMLRSHPNRVYTWRIKHFSEITWSLESPTFDFEGVSWQLQLYPKARDGKRSSLGLYLLLASYNCPSKLYVNFELCIKNQSDHAKDHKITTLVRRFSASARSAGHAAFMSFKDLNRPGFKVGDVVVVEVNITDIFKVKASSNGHCLRKMFCLA